MKRKDIILDFTSLLDVTLIIIFFFVLFSHLDSQQATEKLNNQIQQAELREQEAVELSLQLEEEIGIVKESNQRVAANIKEQLNFNRSMNIKMRLDMEGTTWKIVVSQGDKLIASINSEDNVEGKLKQAFKDAGYTSDSTIFCDFIYRASDPGTVSAYQSLLDSLNALRKDYIYLYVSETDLSIGE